MSKVADQVLLTKIVYSSPVIKKYMRIGVAGIGLILIIAILIMLMAPAMALMVWVIAVAVIFLFLIGSVIRLQRFVSFTAEEVVRNNYTAPWWNENCREYRKFQKKISKISENQGTRRKLRF